MTYNLYFNFCAIIFLIVQFILNAISNRLPSRNNLFFKIFCITSLIAVIVNTLSAWYTPIASTLFLKNLISITHLLLVNSITAVYFIFIVSVVHDNLNFKVKHILLFALPYAYMMLIICTSPFTHFVYYFDSEMQYNQNFGMYTLYLVNLFFLISCFSEIVYNRKRVSKNQLYSVLMVTILVSSSMLFQCFNPKILIIGFFTSIGVYLLQYALRNPKEFIDSNTKVYNREAFKEYFFFKSGKLKKEYFCLVHIKNLDSIAKTYGTTGSYYIIRQIISVLQEKSNIKYIFYLFHGGFAFSTKTQEEGEQILTMIRNFGDFPVEVYPNSKIPTIAQVHFITDFYLLTDSNIIYQQYKTNPEKNPCDTIIELFKYAIQIKTGSELINYIDVNLIADYENHKEHQAIIQKAIEKENFEVFLQPIWNLKTKSFTSAESLLRLKDENNHYISPNCFIPDAEKNGSILRLGEISLRKTCEYILEAQVRERGICKVNVNLSMVQCMQDNIVQNLISIIEDYNIPKTMIRFEITETLMESDPERLLQVMEDLKGYGIEFALDDYGTGFSNTSRLIRFPFSEIKFDKSFINAIIVDKKNEIPLEHLIKMVKAANMLALVEGIEEKEHSDLVEKFGTDLIQGFYYSEPLSLAEFTLKFNTLSKE